jgi:DNA-binding LacI/PurR family transcriptional regulator
MLERQSVSDQVASYLREELKRKRWTGHMPGRDILARELGVHGSTIERALQQLEKEGLVKKSGQGKPRLIVSSGARRVTVTSVCVLLYDAGDQTDDYILSLQHHLDAAGHSLTFAPRSMCELKFDPVRIESMVKQQSADAWIVYSGSREILQKFVELPCPAFALFGRMSGLRIAGSGTDILTALRETVRRLHQQGHRKIVMLTRAQLVESGLGLTERTFIEALEENNIPHGSYNLAGWDNTPSGLRQCLDKLFQVTPPTAIFVDDWMIHNAVQNYLLNERGAERRKVCCISMEYHPSFSWYEPPAPHFYWDPDAVVRCAVVWLKKVGLGNHVIQQKLIKAEFRGSLAD